MNNQRQNPKTFINKNHLINGDKLNQLVNYLLKNDKDIQKIGATGADLTHVHAYTDKDGNLLYFKPRFKTAKGDKWIKPCYDNGNFYRLGLPQAIKDNSSRPIYNLQDIIATSADNTPVYIVEGEKCADILSYLGLTATTTGGATSANNYDLSPLVGRQVIIWADYDNSGDKWQGEMCDIITAINANQGCFGDMVQMIDRHAITLADGDKLGNKPQNQGDYKGFDCADLIKQYHEQNLSREDIYTMIDNLPKIAHQAPSQSTNNGFSDELIPPKSTIEPLAYDGKQKGNFVLYDNRQQHSAWHGVYFVSYGKDAELIYNFISSPIYVLGITRDKFTQNWGRLLEIVDIDGNRHQWIMPMEMLQGDGAEYRKILANKGAIISNDGNARKYLDIYLQTYPTEHRYTSVDSVGWHFSSYVLPHKIFGADKIVLQGFGDSHGYSEKGDLQDWQRLVSLPCANHDRLAFALCVAFSGQLLDILQAGSMGFHFVGLSSMGKSLSMQLACSVWGDFNDFMRTWKATGNGLESVASLHNDSFLSLDEISECSDKQVGDIVYMLGNGQGKTRMGKDGQNKDTKKWRIAYLSTGEKTLKEMLHSAGDHVKAGQEIRLIHINADAGKGLGMFDSLHDTDAPTQAQRLNRNARLNYGVAGVEWINYLTDYDHMNIYKEHQETTDLMLANYPKLSPQKRRVFNNFAIVATAGELATNAGITGWKSGTAINSALACFNDWLATYGRADNLEENEILQKIIAFIQANEHGGRFIRLDTDRSEDKFSNIVGYVGGYEGLYYFTRAGLEEVVSPYSLNQALHILKTKDLLKTNSEKGKVRYTLKLNRKGINGTFYAVHAKVLEYFSDNE